MIRYALAMSSTPANVPLELFEQVKRTFTPAQLVELTSAIAWENYRARFNRAFDVAAQGFSEGAVCRLPPMRSEAAGGT